MCDILTIASIGLGIAQGAASFAAADAQYDQQMEMHRQNGINASRAAENQYANLNIRAQQEGASATQQKMNDKIAAAKAASTIEVAASEGGVSGLSVDHVLRDIYAQHGRNEATLDTNLRMSRDYLAGEKVAAEAGGQNQINSMPVPEKPSFAPYLLNAFGTGINAYSNYRQRRS